jgi:hypothetical protein
MVEDYPFISRAEGAHFQSLRTHSILDSEALLVKDDMRMYESSLASYFEEEEKIMTRDRSVLWGDRHNN